MGKYLDLLKAQKKPETRNQGTDITDISLKSNQQGAYVGYVGCLPTHIENNNVIEGGAKKEPKPEPDPLEALRNDPDIQLLQGDRVWLAEMLLGTTLKRRRELLVEYKRQWLQGMEAEPVGHMKQNKGRFRANTWIRLKGIHTHS